MNALNHARREDGRDRRHAKHDVAPVPDALALLGGFPADIAETSSVFARRSVSLSGLQPARSQPAPWSSRSGNKRAMWKSRSTLCRTVLNGDVTAPFNTLEPSNRTAPVPSSKRTRSRQAHDEPVDDDRGRGPRLTFQFSLGDLKWQTGPRVSLIGEFNQLPLVI